MCKIIQEISEVNTNDTEPNAQTLEPVSESSESDCTTDSESDTSDLESIKDTEDVANRSTLIPPRGAKIEYSPGTILRFLLYSPLRNVISQIIHYFRPKTIRQSAYPESKAYSESKRSLPAGPYPSGLKPTPDGKAYFLCGGCGGYRRVMHSCSRHCVPRSTFRPGYGPHTSATAQCPGPEYTSNTSAATQCPMCGRFIIRGKRCPRHGIKC